VNYGHRERTELFVNSMFERQGRAKYNLVIVLPNCLDSFGNEVCIERSLRLRVLRWKRSKVPYRLLNGGDNPLNVFVLSCVFGMIVLIHTCHFFSSMSMYTMSHDLCFHQAMYLNRGLG